MDRAAFPDIELEYAVRGDGEPVLLIHPGIFADWLTPLFAEPVLASHYRLVHYHGTCGPDYAALDQALPGAFNRYVADAETFLGVRWRAEELTPAARFRHKRIVHTWSLKS